MKRNYHTIASSGKANERQLTEFLSRNGQFLLPMVDLIEQCQVACDELIDVAGRATIQAVLALSAEQGRRRPAPAGQTAIRRVVLQQGRSGRSKRNWVIDHGGSTSF